jgi:uncharacterized protein (DUF983 family)
MELRNNNMKRNMSLTIKKGYCPYCNHTKIWTAKLNVKDKCSRCKTEINHQIEQVKDKYNRFFNKLIEV